MLVFCLPSRRGHYISITLRRIILESRSMKLLTKAFDLKCKRSDVRSISALERWRHRLVCDALMAISPIAALSRACKLSRRRPIADFRYMFAQANLLHR